MISLFFLMCLTTLNTVMRKSPLGGITDSLDITEYFLVLIIYCGMAYLESEKGHIRVDMFLVMLPGALRKYTEAFWYLVSAGILGLFSYAMLLNIGSTYRSGAATQVMHIPQWPFTILVAAAISLYAVTVTLHLIEILIGSGDTGGQAS
jgi:TRAP-type C4-dicarboxylate transport system permease small subunit